MSTSVIIIGLVVGLANYLFRYIPLRFHRPQPSQGRANGWLGRVLDGIGIASICALLVVSSVPEVLRDVHKLWPSLLGAIALTLTFYRLRSIVAATLVGALCFGLAFKFLPV